MYENIYRVELGMIRYIEFYFLFKDLGKWIILFFLGCSNILSFMVWFRMICYVNECVYECFLVMDIWM